VRATAGTALAVALVALAAAASASASSLPHLGAVTKLYRADHGGRSPRSESELLPYSQPYEKLLAACTLKASALTGTTTTMAGELGTKAGTPYSTLGLLRAFTQHVTWSKRRDCWDAFFAVEAKLASRRAATPIRNLHEIRSLYVFDHRGKNARRAVDLVPYSQAFAKIVDSCTLGPEATTNLMIELSQKASDLGARNVSTLQMLQAVARRIDWKARQRPCWAVFDDAEGHMETGGP
jgi:hypothetical protein